MGVCSHLPFFEVWHIWIRCLYLQIQNGYLLHPVKEMLHPEVSILSFLYHVFLVMIYKHAKICSLFLWASAVFIKHLTKCCHVYQDFVNCLDGILSLTLLWSFRKATLSLCCTSLVAWIWIGMTCSAGHVVMNPSKVIRCIEHIWTEPEKCCSGLT